MARIMNVNIEEGFTYEVVSPYYWKYKGVLFGGGTKHSEKVEYYEKSIELNPFTRRLPNGSSVSTEAKNLATKYCIDLDEGYTIVRPFTKTVKCKVK